MEFHSKRYIETSTFFNSATKLYLKIEKASKKKSFWINFQNKNYPFCICVIIDKSGYIDCGIIFWIGLIEMVGFLKSNEQKNNDSHYIVYGNWKCIWYNNSCKLVFNQIHAINRNTSFPFAIYPIECIFTYTISFHFISFDMQWISLALVFLFF